MESAAAADLVQRIEAGDRQAEAELVERYGRTLAFLLRRWTRDIATAQDLYQETIRRALEKIRRGEVRQPERLAGYLRSLAKNLSIHHYRKGLQRREAPLDEAPVPSDSTKDQLTRLLHKEKAALAFQLLHELRDRDRQVLFRFYIAGEDREPIRQSLGLTSSQFNLVFHRARKRYRELFEKRLGEI